MSKIVEIQIDRSTLPADEQKVKWQTYDDFNNMVWKEGTFCAAEDHFAVGFSDSAQNWDLVWDVHRWQPLE